MENIDHDVLVVGAGPSGLIIALCLTMSGVSVRIVDKEPSYRVGRRGAGITPRTLEVFKMLGVLDKVLDLAHKPVPMQSYELPGGLKPLKTWSMSETLTPTPSCPYLNAVFLGQDQVEEILRKRLEAYSCYVELNTELVGFTQNIGHVSTELARNKEGTSLGQFNFKYLIGADGAKGVVRKQLGLSFLGETRTEDKLVVSDVILEGLDLEHIHMWSKGPAATILAWPGQVKERSLFSVQMAGIELDRQKVISDSDEFRAFFKSQTGRNDIHLKEVVWISEYIPNIRMVDELRKDNVFLVGDAAHVHSLFGGQGMNSSVQDSFNLGWKLTQVVRGLSSPDLLVTYSEERLPVIAEMLNKTTELHQKAFKRNIVDDSHWQRSKSLDQLGINYRWSSIVFQESMTGADRGTLAAYGTDSQETTAVLAGDRAPDAPGLKQGNSGASVSLFEVFNYTTHTVLIFLPSLDLPAVTVFLQFLQGLPRQTVQSVIIYPASVTPSEMASDLLLQDEDGHGFRGYFAPVDRLSCVAVRPDGMIGAIVESVTGLKKYFDSVFSASSV
ncbi:monooxygenase [Mycena floridula]|nr:monooxygenase [Mycena floridula]